jgi:dephospho-CoA kinase
MEPGQQVYAEIVDKFGQAVVAPDGRLNRARLADLAFKGCRLQDLNAIVHPATIAAQRLWMEEVFKRDPAAIAVVESALIFEVERDARQRGETESALGDWRRRFDRVVVVTAPDEVKVARFAARTCRDGEGREAAEADARLRLKHQIPDAEKASRADYVLENSGNLESLHAQVVELWQRLHRDTIAESNKYPEDELLK